MKCKLEKLEIPAEQPFKNCKLDREKYADVLKAIITTYNKGFVLAINGKWGTGKTTFVEMWKAYLKLDHFHTLYFNAWENDFISDPLIGLLGELKKMSPQKKSRRSIRISYKYSRKNRIESSSRNVQRSSKEICR